MPHRDPVTGQFVSGSGRPGEQYDEVETVHFNEEVIVAAADLPGTTAGGLADASQFEGILIYDADQIVDRHEVLEFIGGRHHLTCMITSTQTADGSLRATAEVSSSPEIRGSELWVNPSGADPINDQNVSNLTGDEAQHNQLILSETVDLLGPALQATAHGPVTDGTNGVGASGSIESDQVVLGPVPGGYMLDRRDELFFNGVIEASNVDDTSIIASLMGTHHWGVRSE